MRNYKPGLFELSQPGENKKVLTMEKSAINPLLRIALDRIIGANVRSYVLSSRQYAPATHNLYLGVLEGLGVAIKILGNEHDQLQKITQLIEEKKTAVIVIEQKRTIRETNSKGLPCGLRLLEDDLGVIRCEGKLSALREIISMVTLTEKLH